MRTRGEVWESMSKLGTLAASGDCDHRCGEGRRLVIDCTVRLCYKANTGLINF